MPIYEYECEGCHKVFEVTQKMSDPPLKKHADCGSKKVKKLISRSSFQLKGSGWYVTDYANKSTPPSDASGEKSGEKSDEKSPDKAKTEGKANTETKVEAKETAKDAPKESGKDKSKKKKSGEKAA